jgi:hypothetical protein
MRHSKVKTKYLHTKVEEGTPGGKVVILVSTTSVDKSQREVLSP